MNFAWSSGPKKRGAATLLGTDGARRGRSADAVEAASDSDRAHGVYPFYIAATIAPRAAMFVVLIVLTRLLPSAEYGLFALVITAGEILEMASANWIRIYLLRREAGVDRVRPRQLGRALALSAGSTVAGLATSALVVPFINADRISEMMLAVVTYIAAFALLRMTLTLAQLSRNHVTFAVVECGRALGIVTATIVAALMQPHSFLPASVAVSLATGCSAVLGVWLVSPYLPRPIFPRGGYLVALNFGLPFVLANTLLFTIGWFDRFIVNYFLGPAAVAVYVAAYSLARQPVELFVVALNSFTFPLLVRAYANGGAEQAGPIQGGLLTTITVFGTGIVAGLTLLADPLATLLFPRSYSVEVAVLIPWLAAATFILSIKQFVFDNAVHVTQRNWPNLITMLPPVLVSIGLGILLIRSHGLFGAAINYVVVSIVALLGTVFISFQFFAFSIPWRDLAKVTLSLVVATAATWGAIQLFASNNLTAVTVGTIVFCAVYGAMLTVSGFSLRRLIYTPWAPLEKNAQAGRRFSNKAK